MTSLYIIAYQFGSVSPDGEEYAVNVFAGETSADGLRLAVAARDDLRSAGYLVDDDIVSVRMRARDWFAGLV